MRNDKVIRLKEVIGQTGLSSVSIWRKEKAGSFPRRFNLGDHSVGWSQQEISEWIESRKEHARIYVGGGASNV